uniref:TGF-beta family profile domain-containing protein n=1 Tax=Cavia porcellus TaxID=10141 RepID=H0W0E8_CAVPO
MGLLFSPVGQRAPARPPPARLFLSVDLGARERRDMQREILAVLGLPGRPRLRALPAAARLPASAPLFMLDLYHAMAGDDDEDAGPPGRRLGRADLVMSFVNMVEHDHSLGHQEPHWKEFHFDLMQIPAGEAVTAAEFRIYKVPSTHPLNTTLHVSVFEVVRERSNRESDLFFLDLQTLRAGDEGWLVLDVTAASDRWLLNRNKDLGLRLHVETLDGHSVDPGLAGLLGQRAPRSRQPFMVTFFRASPSPIRAPRAVRPLKRRQPKKTNELPHPNRLPGIFGDGWARTWRGWVGPGWVGPGAPGSCLCLIALSGQVHLMKPDAVPKACCAPTKLSATSVLYYDSSNNVILRKHRNMVVKACGCH